MFKQIIAKIEKPNNTGEDQDMDEENPLDRIRQKLAQLEKDTDRTTIINRLMNN
jgi:hypothetical protein